MPTIPRPLAALNKRRWYVRWPMKWAIFGLAYVAVCFPYPRLILSHLRHWSNPNALIQPHAPALQPLVVELRSQMDMNANPLETLKFVEGFVYKHVPYDWDWNTWGMADYLPSVEEVISMGREDCDGRAVIAASLLQNLGIDARLVTDLAHVWVSTPHGETMGPGKTKTIEVTEKGVRFDARGLLQIPQTLGYGIAVFPLPRELILLVVFWGLMLGGTGWPRAIVSFALMLGGLLLVRHGAEHYRGPQLASELFGLGLFIAGAILLVVKRRRGNNSNPQTQSLLTTPSR